MFSLPVILKCTILAAFAGMYHNAPEIFERPWRGPVFGYCDGRFIYASIDGAQTGSAGRIFRQPLVLPKRDERKSTEQFSIDLSIDRMRLYRWRIADNVYFGSSAGIEYNWADTKRIPLADLELFDDANPVPYEKRGDQRLKRYPFDRELSNAHSWYLHPLNDLYEKLNKTRPHRFTQIVGFDGSVRFIMDKEPKIPDVFRDELPIGANKIKLFILQDRRMELWDGSFGALKPPLDPAGTSTWEPTWSRKPVETIRSAFNSGFMVMARGDDCYFITDFGSIFVSHKPAKGERTMEPIWTKGRDPDRNPITFVITDLTTGRMFAFDMDEACPFFEIGAKPEPPDEDRVMVHDSKSPYPLQQVRDCVDTLIKYGKIKPPAKEPAKEKK